MSSSFDAGMALAALLAGDDGGALALPGLAPALGARLAAASSTLAARKSSGGAGAIVEVAREVRARASPGQAEPRRVLAVLASEVDRNRGAVWLAAVPKHRAGWSASADLRAMLVRRTRHDAAERAEAEIAELEASAWPA